MNLFVLLVFFLCNIKQKHKIILYGNVSNVEKNILSNKLAILATLKSHGALQSKMSLDSLRQENEDLRKFISLILAEIELTERVEEIRQNFTNSPDSERIILPIMDRISKIKKERNVLQLTLDLK